MQDIFGFITDLFVGTAYAASSPGSWDSFKDPLVEHFNVNFVANSCTLTVFITNVVLWIVRAILIVLCGYYLFTSIYKLLTSDTNEDFKILQSAIVNSVLSAVGLVIVVSSLFIPASALRLLGIDDADNPFLNIQECPTAVSKF